MDPSAPEDISLPPAGDGETISPSSGGDPTPAGDEESNILSISSFDASDDHTPAAAGDGEPSYSPSSSSNPSPAGDGGVALLFAYWSVQDTRGIIKYVIAVEPSRYSHCNPVNVL